MNADRVFHYFNEISQIERISFGEKEIADYIAAQGEKLGCEVFRDSEHNVILKKWSGLPGSPTVILQAHTDMVWAEQEENTEKGIEHNAAKERQIPRGIHVANGKMRASGTTLGADDGIGVALILALLEHDSAIERFPNLEAVFTSNEEETMGGAMAIRSEQVSGRYLINLDSESEGVFTIGAAGGISSLLRLPIKRKRSVQKNGVKVTVSGGRGGHSGLDIGRKRENAIKLLVRFLQELNQEKFELVSLDGGNRSNAIPDQAEAVIRTADAAVWQAQAQMFMRCCGAEWAEEEPELELQIEEVETDQTQSILVYDEDCKERLLLLLESLPHGVAARTEQFISSSVNLAIVKESDQEFLIELSLRSSYETWLKAETERIGRIAGFYGGNARAAEGYPAWQYQPRSELTDRLTESYERLFGCKPILENVHAGVECGILMQNCPSVKEAISIGPTITGAHTVNEELDIASVQKVFALLKEVLQKMSA